MIKIITGRHSGDLVKAKETMVGTIYFFPEIDHHGRPLHPTDLVERCKTLVGAEQVVTVSEIVIHFLLREVRFGRLDELEIFYVPDQSEEGHDVFMIGVGEDGEILQPWPDSLFDTDYHLQFDSPDIES